MAKDFLCEGVKLRWREGFTRSAPRSSADNVLGDERSSFDVVSESTGGIGGRSGWIIGGERTRRFDWPIIQRRAQLRRGGEN
jgi:hypothetical protein